MWKIFVRLERTFVFITLAPVTQGLLMMNKRMENPQSQTLVGGEEEREKKDTLTLFFA